MGVPMIKNRGFFFAFLLGSVILLNSFSGCTSVWRSRDLTIVSTKNFDVGAKYVKTGTYEAEDYFWVIIIIPTGSINIQTAVDNCIQAGAGDLATNVVFYNVHTDFGLIHKFGLKCKAEIWKKASMGDLRDNKELFELKENQNGVKELVSTKDNNTKYAVIDNSKDLHSQVTFQ